MGLTAGSRLGAYEVLAPLGAGGMGEVYRARDTQLKREVALKVLPDAFASDAERLARFQREAELLATLNHPNIAAVYGLEKSVGTTALVLELVEGDTLADVIARGPVAAADALPIARQIADALEAAHEKGVIHRDLKPANIKITPDGQVKVLDFGLAKLAAAPETSGTALSLSPTLSLQATYAGVILGTAAYMSPEQARGRAVDRRTDVWAFGCVLYEMLTGARPFDGEDLAETIGAVIHKQVDFTRLPADTPATVRTVLERCLQKDPRQRIRDIGDVQLALGGAFASPSPAAASVAAPPIPRWRRLAATGASALGGALVLALALWVMAGRGAPEPVGLVRVQITPPAGQPVSPSGNDRQVVISPVGTHVVWVTGPGGSPSQQLVVRALDRLESEVLRGTTGARYPFISPDGKWIGYFLGVGAEAELRKVSITGGPPVSIARFNGAPRGAAWGADDTIVFATSDAASGLMSVPAGGGEPRVLTKPDTAAGEQDHQHPSFLPDGRSVLFTVSASVNAAQLENVQIALLDLATNQRQVVIRGGSDAVYVDSGHIVYAAAGALRAVKFDAGRREVQSDPVPVLDQLATTASGSGQYSVSRTGALLYVSGGLITAAGGGGQRTLVWVDRRGTEQPIKVPTRSYFALRLSPDGTRVALDVRDQENDIWVWDLARGTLERRTFDRANDMFPVWTPDGRRIVFSSAREGNIDLFSVAADGSGPVERLTKSSTTQMAQVFTRDGSRLIVSDQGSSGDLFALTLDGKTPPVPLLRSSFNEISAALSPDGRWLAYQSNESGEFQVYVRPFPNIDSGQWQVSNTGGTKPVWGPDGRELFYLEGGDMTGRALMRVPVETADTFSSGNPVKLFDARNIEAMQSGTFYDVAPDGKRFIMIKDVATPGSAAAPPTSLVLVLNWFEELKQRLPER